jgi:hypothetical protein
MDEAKDVFNNRISSPHIQRKEMNEFVALLKEGKAISGLSEHEVNSILLELQNDKVLYSNDMVVDMIIGYVAKENQNTKLLKIIKRIHAAIVNDKNIVGRAYPRYSDNSYYIEIGKDIDKRIRLLSDLLAVIFMTKEKNKHKEEKKILPKLLEVCKHRYADNIENLDEFDLIQKQLILLDRFYGNRFTDRYVQYSREINEMALAFFIGHEIGHHYYEHTSEKLSTELERKLAELQADEFALCFSFQYLQTAYKNIDNVYGIHFFVGIYLPLIASTGLCKSICKDDASHPSIIKRLLGVQRGLKKKIDKTAWNNVQEYRRVLLKNIRV